MIYYLRLHPTLPACVWRSQPVAWKPSTAPRLPCSGDGGWLTEMQLGVGSWEATGGQMPTAKAAQQCGLSVQMETAPHTPGAFNSHPLAPPAPTGGLRLSCEAGLGILAWTLEVLVTNEEGLLMCRKADDHLARLCPLGTTVGRAGSE